MDGSEISTSDLLNTSSDTASSTTDQSLTDAAAAVTEANDPPHRIEISTLVQDDLTDHGFRSEYDERFADALNGGWEVMDIAVTTCWDPVGGGVNHTRIVTLMRLVEDEGAPEAAKAEAETTLIVEPPDAVAVVVEGVLDPTKTLEESRGTVPVSRIQDTPQPVGSVPLRVEAVDISYAEAYASGRYTLDELRVIAEREMHQSGLDAFAAWQPQSNPHTGQAWEGLRFNALLAMADGG